MVLVGHCPPKHAREQREQVPAALRLFAGRAGRKPGACRESRGDRSEGQTGKSSSLEVISADLSAKFAGLERRHWPRAVPSVRNSTASRRRAYWIFTELVHTDGASTQNAAQG